ncbi:MAG: GNAT family N-acetyltransferase [Chitinophagales bacterium]|nr:GNAT family N-acetyltransferase [Chitinophagales bacterium]
MEFKEAQREDFVQIENLISIVWEPTYRHIVPQKQINEMFDEFCNQTYFGQQVSDGARFYLAVEGDILLGFVCLYKQNDGIKISKLYVDNEFHKKGIGRFLLDNVQKICKDNKLKYIELNVNRYNKALYFYRRYGFYIQQSEDIPYKEFWLNDYILRLDIEEEINS